MSIYHVTVQHDGTQNRFHFSGEGWGMPPSNNVAESVNRVVACDGTDEDHVPMGEVYKFDQSDPSNNGHPLCFSRTPDGIHDGGHVMGADVGIYHCGTPGQQGAFTKMIVGEWYSVQHYQPQVYPFCLNHAGMGGTSEFDAVNDWVQSQCVDPYSCTCTLEEYLSGMLTGLIHSTNTQLSGAYDNYEITSYSIATGVENETKQGCVITATGQTTGEANIRRNLLAQDFQYHGICTDDLDYGPMYPSRPNVNNASISWGTTPPHFNSLPNGYYKTSVTGFFDKRYYVGYYPEVSGQKSQSVANVLCPDTNFDVTLERDREAWNTTGHAEKQDINRMNVTLYAHCSGYEADLTTRCEKVIGGIEWYCPQELTNRVTGCWEDDFEKGDYIINYTSGGYETANSDWFIGSGHLDAVEII